MILVSFYGCNKDIETYSFTPTGDYVYADQNNGYYIDKVNDAGETFVDLNKLSIHITNENININIGLFKLPDNLIFSQPTLPMNVMNYEWSVYFDVDNSGSLNKGDISMSIMKFKFNDSIVNGNILSETQKNIWLYTGTGFKVTARINEYVSINGNDICFSIPRSVDSSLVLINNKTNFYFKACFNDGINVYTDYYPDKKQQIGITQQVLTLF